jgi:predicted phosphodiesterase
MTLTELAHRVPVVVIAGDHDRRGLRRHLPTGAPGLIVVDEPTRLPVDDLLVCLQSFDGAQVPGLTFRVGKQRETVGAQHLPPCVRFVLCGHIHPRQVVEVGDAVVVHPGSTERTSFHERHEVKGIARWELGREVLWHFEDLDTRPMCVVGEHADLGEVVPEGLVRIPALSWTPELETQVLDRGGWLWGAPPEAARAAPPRSAQLGLFV